MLTAANLTRHFGDRVAVDDVSLELVPGEIFALLGPNGAGKTTTLRMLAGLIAPTSGTIRLGADSLDARNASSFRLRIGFLTEAPGLWERLSVRQNLETYARLYGLRDPGRRTDQALATFDLTARAGDPAGQLSKGLKQRAALARTLLHEPEIVLLDEPTSGLDPESARSVRDLVLRLRDEGRAVLLSTHNLDEVERVATRVAVLRTTLLAVDTPAALRARLFDTRVRVELRSDAQPFAALLRSAGVRDLRTDGFALSVGLPDRGGDRSETTAWETPEIVRYLVENGARVEAVIPERPTLEDVYLRLLRDDTGDGKETAQ